MDSEGAAEQPGQLADLLRRQRVHGLDHPGRIDTHLRADVLDFSKGQPLGVVDRRHAGRRLQFGFRVQLGSAAQDECELPLCEAMLVEWISHVALPPKRLS
jgi:hypothetical protein